VTQLLLLASAVAGGSAAAEEVDAGVQLAAQEVDAGVQPQVWGGERILGGHLFQYPTLTASPFLSTTLNFEIVSGFNNTKTTSTEAGVDITTVQQASPLVLVDLTVHVADPVSVFLDLTGAFASGITAASLVLKGETLSYAIRTGAIVRLLRDEPSATQLSLLGGFRYVSGTSINLKGLVDLLNGNGNIKISDIINGAYGGILITPFNSYDGQLDVAVAHAFERWLGMQASLGIVVDYITSNPLDVVSLNRYTQSQVNTIPSAAVALTFSGNEIHVPVALQLEYRLGITWASANESLTTPASTTTSFSNAFALGIFYAGRSDFQAGLVLVASIHQSPVALLGPGNPNNSQNSFAVIFPFRYVW
jgi:hypothetical protein